MNNFSDFASKNTMLIWSILSFFLGGIFGVYFEELKQLYKERGRLQLLNKRMDLIYGTYDANGNKTTPLNGSPMLEKAEIHLSVYNNSRRNRTIRNIKVVGQVRNGDHFDIDFSDGKVAPSFVVELQKTLTISIKGELASLTSFLPFAPEDLTIELVYGLDNGDVKYTQFANSEISIIEAPHTEWKIF